MDAVGLDPHVILDGHAEAEEGLDPGFHEGGDQKIGEREVVGGGILQVGVKVPEEVRDVDVEISAEAPSHVVQPGKGDPGGGEPAVDAGKINAGKGRLSHSVQGLDPVRHDGLLSLSSSFFSGAGGRVSIRS